LLSAFSGYGKTLVARLQHWQEFWQMDIPQTRARLSNRAMQRLPPAPPATKWLKEASPEEVSVQQRQQEGSVAKAAFNTCPSAQNNCRTKQLPRR
jgi:hypothetical protein